MEDQKLILFLADYDHQINRIKEIYLKLEKKSAILSKSKVNSDTIESTGYWLHNLYCAFEDLFKIVTAFWENNISPAGTFHKDLIKKMIMNIQGIRPALISDKSYQSLDELRGFRHVFRHAYSYGLDDERVKFILKRILRDKKIIFADLTRFRKQVNTMKS